MAKKAPAVTIDGSFNDVEKKWKDLGAVKVKASFEKRLEEKLDDILGQIKSGDWKLQFQRTIINLLSDATDTSFVWYGHMLAQCQIRQDLSMPSPAGVSFHFNKYVLWINPVLFNLYSVYERQAILKHEMLHLIYLHTIRRNHRHPRKWNYATDIAINQFIKNLPQDGLLPELFGLPEKLSAEQYFVLFPEPEQEEQKQKQSCSGSGSGNGDGEGSEPSDSDEPSDGKGKGKGNGEDSEEEGEGDGEDKSNKDNADQDIIDDERKLRNLIAQALDQNQQGMIGNHDKWEESKGNEEIAKEIARQMSETATQKSRGSIPNEAMNAIVMLNEKEQFDWKKMLRRITGNKKAFTRPTIKKSDRRFPSREDLRGKTYDRTCDVLVVLDVSGSMSNEELQYGLNEVRAICKKTKAGVKIIQVDTQAHEVEDFKPFSDTFSRKAAGGTYLWPAIEMAMEKKVKFNAVVMITDGCIENSWDANPVPKVPFMWLVSNTNKLELNISGYPQMAMYNFEVGGK